MGRIVHPQSALNPEAHVLEQALERNKSVAKAQTDAKAQAGYVRAAQNQASCLRSACAQRSRSPGSSAISDERMRTSARSISATLWTARSLREAPSHRFAAPFDAAETRSEVSDDARVDGLDAITAGQHFPRAAAMSLEDDIGIQEDRG